MSKKQWHVIEVKRNDCKADEPSTYLDAFGENEEEAALDLAEQKFEEWDCPKRMEIWVLNFDEGWKRFEVTRKSPPTFSVKPMKAIQ